jgi:4-hydroxybenzoate polyprenyltransferase
VYLALTLAYSLYLKRLLLLDVLLLAGLYTLRLLAGGAAVGIALTPWLLAFSLFFFLGLAFAKRYGELCGSTRSAAPTARGAPIAAAISTLLMSRYDERLPLGARAVPVHQQRARGQPVPAPGALWFLVPLLLYWSAGSGSWPSAASSWATRCRSRCAIA